MCRYYADVSCPYLHKLYLARRTPWESNDLRAEAAKSKGVVCSLEHRKFFRWRRESVHVYGIVQHNNDPGPREADTVDWGAELKGNDCFLLCIVPDNDLMYDGKTWQEYIGC